MKCKTGIKGFDELVEGGLVEGSSVLLAGNPGTGKTFAAEMLLDIALKKTKGLFSSGGGTEKGLKDALAKCVSAGILDSNFKPEKSKKFIDYFKESAPLIETISAIFEAHAGSPSAQKKSETANSFKKLMTSLKAIANASGKSRDGFAKELESGISTNVYVLPSASSATDILAEEAYVISSSGIERMVSHPIIQLLTEAYSGKMSMLIIDEASETLKEKESA
ncbi:MAG: AAA family ATPase, partial [Candidatus Woesearchaeota archaeon]|nr:AAA family ATPase [Candidatus Woesearchaeota archaeon]